MAKHYLTDCVASDARSIDAMTASSREISHRAFVRQVSREDLQSLFPDYSQDGRKGLALKDDWHVRYYKSAYRGRPCLYCCHSSIEYVFV